MIEDFFVVGHNSKSQSIGSDSFQRAMKLIFILRAEKNVTSISPLGKVVNWLL
jgi:hypothetical protein